MILPRFQAISSHPSSGSVPDSQKGAFGRSGKTIAESTDREALRKGAVSRVLQLAWIAPDIATDILEGRQQKNLTATRLRTLTSLPLSWEAQRRALGFERS